MFTWLRCLSAKKSPRRQARATRRVQPTLEALEAREVMTVTPHGGAVLPNVEVQALYYGSAWFSNYTLSVQAGQFEGFLNSIVHSSYMDMLGNAGYGVGRGSFSGGKINMSNLGSTVQDSDIRNAIESTIKSGNPLAAPDANRLYVVFVQPNVEVINGSQNSVSNFAGYHSAFTGTDAQGHAVTIRYAVLPTPGGTVNNAKNNYALNNFDEMTEAASHELAEAVTDPDPFSGYADGSKEIGDLANAQTVYLNGYAVQRIADKNDQAMTPAGATAVKPVSFVLQTNGNLYLHSSSGLTLLSRLIVSVSDQGIDNNGHAMVDVVTTFGYASEYHEGVGWTYLTGGVKTARAGQGVSYVLLNDGSLWEYKDAGGAGSKIDTDVAVIDAGTDKFGVNMVTEVKASGLSWEHSDSTGLHYLGSGIKAVSAGQQGVMDILSTNGNVYWHSEASGALSLIDSNVAAVTTGTDASGNYMIDLLYTNGNVSEYRVGSGWSNLTSGVQSIAKGRAGVVDLVFSSGDAYDHSLAGWTYLTGSVKTVA